MVDRKDDYTVTVELGELFIDRHGQEAWYAVETWRGADGKVGRDFGPPIIHRHPLTHVAMREEYVDEKGRLHRDAGPAVLHRDAYTGDIERVLFFKNGEYIDSQNHWDNGDYERSQRAVGPVPEEPSQ